jgi:hypothetical protein
MNRSLVFALSVVAVAAGCSGKSVDPPPPPPPPAAVASVNVSLASSSVPAGLTIQASVVLRDATGNILLGRVVGYTSDNTSVATVNPATGLVTGVLAGTANITATSEGINGSVQVTVTPVIQVTLDSVRPAVLVMGQSGTAFGSNFGLNPGQNVVTVGGTSAVIVTNGSSQVSFVVPDLGCVPAARRTVTISANGTSASQVGTRVAPGVTPLQMPVGGVRVLSTTQLYGCMELAANASPSDYVFIAANANPSADVLAPYRFSSATGDSVVYGAGGYTVMAAARQAPVDDVARALAPQNEVERRIRGFERSRLDRAVGTAFLRQRAQLGAARAAASTSARLTVSFLVNLGDTISLRAPNANTNDLCANFFTDRAVVKAVGTRAIILEDTLGNGKRSGSDLTGTDFTAIAAEFDNVIYSTDSLHFGNPTDIDLNSRVMIFITPQVNKLTPRGSGGFVGGFFFIGDLFPPAGCTGTNQAEIFYVLAPDPQQEFGDVRSVTDVRQGSRGTIAHEFQHMINGGNRLKNGSPSEATWLDEAMAHLAEDLVGRAVRGFSVTGNLTDADVRTNANDYQAFFFQNAARLREWMKRPDLQGATSSSADTSLATRGAAWSLLRYTADQYSGGNLPFFTRAMATGPQSSVANLTARAGVPFDSLMAGWMVALYADDFPVAGLSAKYTYTSYNIRSYVGGTNAGVYPLVVNGIAAGSATLSTQSKSGSGNYFRFQSTGVSPAGAFRLLDPAVLTPATFTGARVYVVRVN